MHAISRSRICESSRVNHNETLTMDWIFRYSAARDSGLQTLHLISDNLINRQLIVDVGIIWMIWIINNRQSDRFNELFLLLCRHSALQVSLSRPARRRSMKWSARLESSELCKSGNQKTDWRNECGRTRGLNSDADWPFDLPRIESCSIRLP